VPVASHSVEQLDGQPAFARHAGADSDPYSAAPPSALAVDSISGRGCEADPSVRGEMASPTGPEAAEVPNQAVACDAAADTVPTHA
jgi:hypothetical protein